MPRSPRAAGAKRSSPRRSPPRAGAKRSSLRRSPRAAGAKRSSLRRSPRAGAKRSSLRRSPPRAGAKRSSLRRSPPRAGAKRLQLVRAHPPTTHPLVRRSHSPTWTRSSSAEDGLEAGGLKSFFVGLASLIGLGVAPAGHVTAADLHARDIADGKFGSVAAPWAPAPHVLDYPARMAPPPAGMTARVPGWEERNHHAFYDDADGLALRMSPAALRQLYESTKDVPMTTHANPGAPVITKWLPPAPPDGSWDNVAAPDTEVYVGNSYIGINKFMRTGDADPAKMADAASHPWENAFGLTRAAHPTTRDTVVFRGANFHGFSGLNATRIFSPAPVSTSEDFAVAASFHWSTAADAPRTIMEIFVPKGTLVVGQRMTSEVETLLPPGTVLERDEHRDKIVTIGKGVHDGALIGRTYTILGYQVVRTLHFPATTATWDSPENASYHDVRGDRPIVLGA